MNNEISPFDHRILGRDMNLFHLQEEGKGMVFWHPKGWTVFRSLEQYIRNKLDAAGYVEVKTPQVMDKALWERSGHWDKFKQNMFICETAEDETLAIKPMNCPSHIQIFNIGLRSYKELPLRMAEFGSCHRYEASGGLHGIMRVRSFTQDDAHIFCREDQVIQETRDFIDLLRTVYSDLGVTLDSVKLALRPDKRAGTDEMWNVAEAQLEEAALASGIVPEKIPNDGAFYGPKLEFHLKDSMGRAWQCGTIQLDFVLPTNLDAKYTNEEGKEQVPVMLHRAILGTFERFLGIYLEHTKGHLPAWMTPVQVAVCPIVTDLHDYSSEVHAKLIAAGIRSEHDTDAATLSAKIRYHETKKVPFMIIVGKKERENGTITVRHSGGQDTFPLDGGIAFLKDKVVMP